MQRRSRGLRSTEPAPPLARVCGPRRSCCNKSTMSGEGRPHPLRARAFACAVGCQDTLWERRGSGRIMSLFSENARAGLARWPTGVENTEKYVRFFRSPVSVLQRARGPAAPPVGDRGIPARLAHWRDRGQCLRCVLGRGRPLASARVCSCLPAHDRRVRFAQLTATSSRR